MLWQNFLFSLNIKVYFWRYDMRGTNLFSFLLNTHSEQILIEASSSDFHLGVSKAV